MKNCVLLTFFLLLVSFVTFAAKTADLVIYTYDSFAGEPTKAIIPKFEKEYNCHVKVLSYGDAGSVLGRIILEKNNPKADIFLGIDANLLPKALKEGIFQQYKPSNIFRIKDKALIFDKTFHVIPYDYGAIALVYNKEYLKGNPPTSFKELLSPRWKRSLIVEDPRTSSTGSSFLVWTVAVFTEKGYLDYWKKLLPNILTITSGWDEAFGMLSKGEAPIMVSYATDAAYSQYYYRSNKYGVVIPSEGAYIQMEGVGILKGARHLTLAKRFMDFVLTDAFQKEIPLTQWMYPVTDVPLPSVYKYAPEIKKIVSVDPEEVARRLEVWIKNWADVIASK